MGRICAAVKGSDVLKEFPSPSRCRICSMPSRLILKILTLPRSLRVDWVLYQPEAAGDYSL